MKVNLCRHIKINGLQCRGAALTRSVFCYFHIAPPGRICEIDDPYESEFTDSPECSQPPTPIETAAPAVVQNAFRRRERKSAGPMSSWRPARRF